MLVDTLDNTIHECLVVASHLRSFHLIDDVNGIAVGVQLLATALYHTGDGTAQVVECQRGILVLSSTYEQM